MSKTREHVVGYASHFAHTACPNLTSQSARQNGKLFLREPKKMVLFKFCRDSKNCDRIYPERSEGAPFAGIKLCVKILRLASQDKFCSETRQNLFTDKKGRAFNGVWLASFKKYLSAPILYSGLLTLMILSAPSNGGVLESCGPLLKQLGAGIADLMPGGNFRKALRIHAPQGFVGAKLEAAQLEKLRSQLRESVLTYYGANSVPKPSSRNWSSIPLDRIFFAQGLGPKVTLSIVKKYYDTGVTVEPIFIELPLKDATFAYLVWEGHHRITSEILKDITDIEAKIWTLEDVTNQRTSQFLLLDMIEKLSTHLDIIK